MDSCEDIHKEKVHVLEPLTQKGYRGEEGAVLGALVCVLRFYVPDVIRLSQHVYSDVLRGLQRIEQRTLVKNKVHE